MTPKDKVQTTSTFTKECTSCLDRYCETCPVKSYTCETYKTGKFVQPKYVFFNYTEKSLMVRFEKMVNFSRLNEYLSVLFPSYTLGDQYTIISNNKTGNFDVKAYMSFKDSIAESLLDIKFSRIVNWNYGDPADFYTIQNKTYSFYTGWYDIGFTQFSKMVGMVTARVAKVLIIGGTLFDPHGMTKIIKL